MSIPPHVKDLTGRKVGRLVVLSYLGLTSRGKSAWRCRCDCGEIAIVLGQYLSTSRTKSCGCLRRQTAVKNIRSGK